MSDLIDRQAAIDALRNYLVGKNVPCDGTLTCRLIENEVINKLPSAQLGTNLAEVGTDTISRDAVKELLNNNGLPHHINPILWKELNNLPFARPKRGKWIEDKGQQILMQNFIERGEVWRVCSICGAGHMIGHKYAIDKAYHDRHHNYCPNCGAKMEGVNNESD